jgi:hypothetical protein
MFRACRIDRQCSPASPGTLYHYIIVRADLPHGSQVAQTVHAAGESALPRPVPGTIAVALHARDLGHLRDLAAQLRAASLAHAEVVECADDPRWPGELMAIGLHPTTDRAAVRKVLSSLALVR